MGDSGVGKTRLVCARAYLQPVALAQLVKTHVPTIWAIDQYRIYKDVSSRTLATVLTSAANRSIGSTTSCTITEKAPTRAFSWLKVPG